jgi:hypothetical protein
MQSVSAVGRHGGARAVVLVAAYSSIDPECDEALCVLEKRGYEVRKLRGNASLALARSQMATDALTDGFEWLVWVDADMRFDPDDVDRLRAHGLPFVAAIGAKKGKRELACHVMPGTHEILFGRSGGLLELRYVGCAFAVTRRGLYEQMRDQLQLPTCNERFGRPIVPYFIPTVVMTEEGPWFLEEDYSFCERAQTIGVKVMADSRIRVHHVGAYPYSWEDAGRDVERFEDYRYLVRS